jgi:putative ABC transport system substrate-binding protein
VVGAQQAAIPVVGFFHPGSADAYAYVAEGFRRGLAEAGYVDGRNVTIEYRWADGHYDRLSALAEDFVRRGVTVICACGTSAPGLAAKAATTTIPIVFQTGGDPVADGLVPSMNRPGGNITGVTRMSVELDPKRLDLLHEVVPSANVFALLVNSRSPRADVQIKLAQKAARSLGLGLEILKVADDNELGEDFATMARLHIGALVVAHDPSTSAWAKQIADLSVRHAIPAIFGNRPDVIAGGLMSYDSSITDSFRQAGTYVGRVLKGERPADLPILEPTRFEFVLNLKTAKALGLTIPPTVLTRADDLID